MSETLWTAAEAAAAIGGEARGDWSVTGANFDTRDLQPGDLFVAIKGASRDGHDFLAQAYQAGAAAALVSYVPEGFEDAPLLIAPGDTLQALEKLGAAGRARAADLYAIGVTGSVGKTSTKDMLGTMLRPQGKTHAAAKSFNNHLGVPLTLARTPQDARFGVYEIGMNAPGEIAPLARMVRPRAAIITLIGPVHLEAFPNGIDGIADEKAAIFEGLEAGGTAILNRDDPQFERLAARARDCGAGEILEFGWSGTHARLRTSVGGDETKVTAEFFGKELKFTIGAPGMHFATNALGALLAVRAAGANVQAAAASLADWGAVAGRGARERVRLPKGGEILLIDESYNANPVSLGAALQALSEAPGGRRVAFLTDMLELGAAGEALHAEIAKEPLLRFVHKIHTAGPLMAALHEALPRERRGTHARDAETLAELAPGMVEAGDAVMVKGSLGSRARLIAERLRALRAKTG